MLQSAKYFQLVNFVFFEPFRCRGCLFLVCSQSPASANTVLQRGDVNLRHSSRDGSDLRTNSGLVCLQTRTLSSAASPLLCSLYCVCSFCCLASKFRKICLNTHDQVQPVCPFVLRSLALFVCFLSITFFWTTRLVNCFTARFAKSSRTRSGARSNHTASHPRRARFRGRNLGLCFLYVCAYFLVRFTRHCHWIRPRNLAKPLIAVELVLATFFLAEIPDAHWPQVFCCAVCCCF